MSAMKLSAALALFAVAACSKTETPKADTTAMAPATPGAMGTMGTMAGDGMAMGGPHSDSIAARAQTDLNALRAAKADDAVRMVPAHAQAVNALIADCEQMMTKMKMTPPAKWHTAVAAIRADLAKMTSANAGALHAMVPAHADRVKAILDMRHDMMKM